MTTRETASNPAAGTTDSTHSASPVHDWEERAQLDRQMLAMIQCERDVGMVPLNVASAGGRRLAEGDRHVPVNDVLLRGGHVVLGKGMRDYALLRVRD